MKKYKIKKILDEIGMIIIILTIVTFNLIIGANEKPLPTLIICVLLSIIIIILAIKKLIFKDNIVIKNKLDLVVLIFMISLCLPFIFRTYCTYQGTVEFMIKYLFVYSLYLLIRNVVNTDNRVNIIITTTIIASLIFIIIGLDIEHGNHFYTILEKLNLKYTKVSEFSSTFGYANTIAIYLLFCIYLAIYRIENINNKVYKFFYVLYILLASYIIYLTSTRIVILLLISSILFFIAIKNYNIIRENKRIALYITIGIGISLLLFVIYANIAMKYSTPCPLENFKKIKKEFIPNQKYILNLQLEVENLYEDVNEDTEIQIIQVNKYFQEKKLASRMVLGNNNIRFEFTPTDSVYYIKIKVENLGKKKITINKCYINDEEYVLKCKYMPNTIYAIFQAFNLQDEGLLQRTQFYKACVEISKNSLLIGQGGDTWKKLYYVYQKYPAYIKETHSYFFELLISYGIIGVIGFLLILVVFFYAIIKEIIKNKDWGKKQLSIIIGFTLLILHSFLFDFNMSFIVVILAVFEYFAMLYPYKEEVIIKNKTIKAILDYIVLAILITIFIVSLKRNIADMQETYVNKTKICDYVAEYNLYSILEQGIKNGNIRDIQKQIEKEPYYYQNYTYEIYWEELFNDIDILSEQKFKEYVNFGIEIYKKIPAEKTFNYNSILNRVKYMINIINYLKEINTEYTNKAVNDIKEIIFNEYNRNIINMKDSERNIMSEKEINEIIKIYESYIEKIKNDN